MTRNIDTLTADAFRVPIANVPTILYDETAYSWYCRLSTLNGDVPPVVLGNRAFNSPYSALAHDLPERVEKLICINNLPLGDAMSFAREHTLAGYFLPFMSSARIKRIKTYMSDGTPKDIKMHMGVTASRVTGMHPLKSCSRCVETDRRDLGFAYWRLDHQAPSSWVCLRHRILLSMTELQKVPRHYRQWFRPGEQERLPDIANLPKAALNVLDKLSEFSSKVSKLPPGHLSKDRLSRVYRQAFRGRDLATQQGVLRLQKIVPLIRETYGPCRSLPGFRVLDNVTDDWAGFVGAARPRARPAHPFKHLLLIALVFDRWEDFVDEIENPDPSGDIVSTPEPAIVDDRPERFRELVTSLDLSLTAAARQVGITTTTATQWAAKFGISYTPRTKTLDDAIFAAARKLLRKGLSRLAIADQLPISPASLTRLLSREPELRDEWRAAIFSQQQTTNRAAFLDLIERNPGVPVKALRRIPGNGYTWLYRHDRDWLIENLPFLPDAKHT
jgi:Tn7-like transposition protein D/TniQ